MQLIRLRWPHVLFNLLQNHTQLVLPQGITTKKNSFFSHSKSNSTNRKHRKMEYVGHYTQ